MFYSFNNIGYNKWDRKALLSLFAFKTLSVSAMFQIRWDQKKLACSSICNAIL